jgi:HPt (histidine-containing phosphotransfer) domain-containing protein
MDPDDLHDMARVFLETSPDIGRHLHAAAAAGDAEQLRFLVHRLTGTLGFFDAQASAVAGRLEAVLMDGRPPNLGEIAAALDGELSRVVSVLQARVETAVPRRARP